MKENKRMNLLTMEHITKAYTDRVLLNDVAFSINENEKIGVIGINGMGKSTLLKVTAGIEPYDEGKISMGKQVKICYLPQTPEFEEGTTVLRAAIADNVNELNQWTIEADARSMLNQLGFYDYDEKVEHMSGGQKKRIALVNALLTPADILVLDEPTNHLDIFMRETLTDALSAYTGTLLLVTHDRYLMQTLGCPILYLEDGKATFYQNFQKLHDRDTSKQPEPAKQEDKPQKAGYGKEQRRRRAEVRTRLKALETEIEELGAHIVELENEINDPEVLRDHLLLRDKCDELDDSRFHQQELYDEWEKLAEEQDRMDAESDS